jgi:hypothetical protein
MPDKPPVYHLMKERRLNMPALAYAIDELDNIYKVRNTVYGLQRPSPEMARKLSVYFDVPAEELFTKMPEVSHG